MRSITINKKFFESPKWIKFKEPILDFGISDLSKTNHPLKGIQNQGPYDYNMGERSFDSINIVVLAPENKFYKKQIMKVFKVMKERQKYFKGFKGEFRLDNVFYPDKSEFFLYEIDNKASIKSAIDGICKNFSSYSNKLKEPSIIYAIGPDYRVLGKTPNYNLIKKETISAGFPSQYMSDYTSENDKVKGLLARTSDYNFIYPLWNIMLATYAKTGGIPWTLKNYVEMNSNPIDLAIGYRFAKNRQSDMEDFVVGVASIFGSNGRWKGYHFSEIRDYKEMRTKGLIIPQYQMEDFLEEIIRQYRRWELSEKPRNVVVHKHGFFNQEELNAADIIFNTFGTSYTMFEITNFHNFRLFSMDNPSRDPYRGLTKEIARNKAIIFTTGIKQYDWYNNRKKEYEFELGTPKPILVNIIKEKNGFKDPIKAANHVFSLTALHWQYVFSGQSSLPVTLEYAHDIAKKIAKGIKPHDNLKSVPWFL